MTAAEDKYPDYCLRGLSDPNAIDDNGVLTCAAFNFNTQSDLRPEFNEASINWEDKVEYKGEADALTQLQEQERLNKNGQIERQFPIGIIRLKKYI